MMFTASTVSSGWSGAWAILEKNAAQAFGVAAVVVLLCVIGVVIQVVHRIALSIYQQVIKPAQEASVEHATLLARASEDARQAAESNRVSQSIGLERDRVTSESIRRLDTFAARLDQSIDRHEAIVNRQAG